ncbi:alginate O-acetylation protein [Clostridium tetani]|uniref:MBOAT family O-acyltransferase n=1 Tax=Clostridium tetani TaxID=1513 RepID=UPI000D21563F|nr:MBOAT family O-acyltransferase [Clostridium tetani]AVP54836.1 transcriptional regulator [Clostridium tetani]RXI75584.1 MBOAT family protein [Clostridium tetani]WFN62418.1 MBOAT family protein [Clostridium tetani]SUY54603.1 alginate O-acetylation protein [Clostridium tetani]BDR71699.1 alginate regulatory protein [Clostridium tetani]
MVFSSLVFIFVFLPITLLTYYISPKKLRNLILLIASLIFYAWGEPIYIFLMMFTTVFSYFSSLFIDKYKNRKGTSLALFILSVMVNLGILCFFKYYGFFIDNINNLFSMNINVKKLPLPVGISFYTFQTLSYVIDVYLEKVPVQKNIISFSTYVTMFPQLVAGPIVKYGDINKQLDNRKESLDKFGDGVSYFIRGLSKKVLLANNLGLLWTTVKATSFTEISIFSAWLGIIAFTLQIYFDFSGYSDMAIGLGKFFGFELMENFNYPYISRSVTEFWRRWHISLGSWFREYVYIPLGGNRTGAIRQYRNLFIVWFLTGFWHGSNWNFIIWGLYFGVFITLEKVFILKWLNKIPKFISHFYTLIILIVGWAIFEFENTSLMFSYIKTMFGMGSNPLIDNQSIYYLYTNLFLFMLAIIFSTPLPKKLFQRFIYNIKLRSFSKLIVPIIYLILIFLCTTYLVNETYNPFLYFKF